MGHILPHPSPSFSAQPHMQSGFGPVLPQQSSYQPIASYPPSGDSYSTDYHQQQQQHTGPRSRSSTFPAAHEVHHQYQHQHHHNQRRDSAIPIAPEGPFQPSYPPHGAQYLPSPRPPSQYYLSSLPQQNAPHPVYQLAPQPSPVRKPGVERMVGRPGFPDMMPNRGGRARFTPEDDQLLKWLKESASPRISWEQIAEFFPGRKSGTLQVRYCTKLKEKGPMEWTEDMDKKLLAAARDYEADRYKVIAGKMGPSISAASAEERHRELEERQRLEAVDGPADPEARE